MCVCSNQNHLSKHAGSYCLNQNHPSKHAGSYSEAFWLWPIMAIMASVQPELGKIIHAGSNLLHLTWFCSSKEGPGHIMQNWPGPDLDDHNKIAPCGMIKVFELNWIELNWIGPVWFWPNASCPESSQCARITGPPFQADGPLQVSHFQTWLHSSTDGSDHIVQNQPRSELDGLVRFWPNASGPEASRSARITGPRFKQMARYRFPTFRLGCILPQTAQIILCKTSPDLNWMAWSGFGLTLLVQKQAGVQESLGLLLASASKLIQIRCELDPASLLGSFSGLKTTKHISVCSYPFEYGHSLFTEPDRI